MVECQLPKLDVAGSNPVSRSNILKIKHFQLNMAIHQQEFDVQPCESYLKILSEIAAMEKGYQFALKAGTASLGKHSEKR